jgi:signal transduction histidine kinase
MRLADFIRRDMEAILAAWESFATTLTPAATGMSSLALRDHAQQILLAIAADIAQPQTRTEQSEKSLGRAPRLLGAPETAAETHAVLRAKSGFDINQMVSEYRALRASVLRLWTDDCLPAAPHADDVIRFSEAIDQAIAESVAFFSRHAEQSRNLLLGMLGHDLRSPLNTILTTAEYLAELNADDRVSKAASRLIRSGASMKSLLDDLVDFNRTKLGLGINVVPAVADLAELFGDELDQLRGAYPGREFRLELDGDTRGRWDGARLQQVLRNLVTNALRYGTPGSPVRILVTGEASEVRLEVRNQGPAIEQASMDRIFDPLQRGTAHPDPTADAPGGLGLGLYIVREVAHAHGGEVTAQSSDGETSFAVRLPRRVV